MIITKIHGGLGNQMFQYAIAKAIAKKREDAYKVDISFYPNQTLRKYQLSFFNIKESIATLDEVNNLKGKDNLISKIRKKLKVEKQSYYLEKIFSVYDKTVFKYKDNLYLDGYWQNEKYFLDIREDLIKEFTLKNEISDFAKKYLKKINYLDSVSIHIRRGDYIANQHTNSVHGVCNIEYYKNAIEYINNIIKNPNYFIFSDDIVWCKENFDFLKNKIFVDDTKSEFEDLELMKNCKHNIIANSTFSWWSAWLNNNDGKVIIAPKQWFSDSKMQESSGDIIPKQWIRI